jgi:flagellar biosynthesis protein FlhG
MSDIYSENKQAGSSFEPELDPTSLNANSGSRMTHYQHLNVDPKATRLEIRESYLRLKNTYSAGSAALYSLISEEDAAESMAKVEEAFRVLNDQVQRRAYDHSIGLHEVAEERISGGTSSYDASYGLDDHQVQTERISYLRDQNNDGWGQEQRVSAPVRTTLPIVKTKATAADTEALQEKFAQLIGEADPSDGDLLRQLREAAGVSVDELQDRTKVCLQYIRDIEANTFDRLPQVVYVRGFLRSILKYLGVQGGEELIKAYSARLETWLTERNSKS